MTASALKFQVGARTLASVPRRLHRVSWSLADVLARTPPRLPPLGDADGWLVTSVPEALAGGIALPGTLTHVRQRYVRYWTDLTIGHDAWLAGLSGNARAGLKRKAKKLAGSGRMDVRRYRTPDLAEFAALARPLSALTYQHRLLGSGLPDRLATVDARAWLLLLDDAPIAYLYCTARDGSLLYDHVGHDPAWGALSPGTVLHARAFADLFAEGAFARFDFTEGEGQHKRQFATGGEPCADLLILRATVANRIALAALAGWDGAMALAKRGAAHPKLKRWADRIRR